MRDNTLPVNADMSPAAPKVIIDLSAIWNYRAPHANRPTPKRRHYPRKAWFRLRKVPGNTISRYSKRLFS